MAILFKYPSLGMIYPFKHVVLKKYVLVTVYKNGKEEMTMGNYFGTSSLLAPIKELVNF